MSTFQRNHIEDEVIRTLVEGENVRDYRIVSPQSVLFPYRDTLIAIDEIPGFARWLWPCRTVMGNRATFAKLTYFEEGRPWWEWHQVALDRLRTPLSIAFAAVVTGNHFVLDRGSKVFKQSAPVIKLKEDLTIDDHLAVLGILNSSTACFWIKQVFHDRGNGGYGGGIASEDWERFYDIDCTKLHTFPLTKGSPPMDLVRDLDAMAMDLAVHQPLAVCANAVPARARLDLARVEGERIFREMVAVQEELDWHCLYLYGLSDDSITVPVGETVPPLNLGERAFEIVLARQVDSGGVETAWFNRHGSKPITELPNGWPEWYRDLVLRRIELIERDRDVALVECPENKRRWSRDSWEKLESEALEIWLLDQLEDRRLWFEGADDSQRAACRSVAQLADKVVATNPDFLDVARVWKGVVEVDPAAIVAELVAEEHVPAQAASRYKSKGFEKRRQWERTWELQRIEDRGEDLPDGLGRIPVPPKFGPVDFATVSYYKQRGKLDLPKERFTSVAGAEGDVDSTMVLAWAGFDHAQLAQAIGTLLMERQQNDGWDADRSWPLVVAMAELLPWLAQWHADVDSRLGDSPAGLYRAFTEQQALAGGRSLADAPDWRPAAPTRGRKKKENA
jgi:hypothetical protein